MALPSAIWASLLLLALPASAQTDNGNECSCFRTNGTSQGYFLYHRFHDWRNVSSAGAAPAITNNADNATNSLMTSSFFTDASWTNDWQVVNWNNSLNASLPSTASASSDATVLMINSPSNVYIESSTDSDPTYSSYLTLRTTRRQDFQSAAEIDSIEQNFQYLSARFFARVTGSSGACAGMFTYLPNDNANLVQEADIEILTQDPRDSVQYTNQPSLKNGNAQPQATVNGTNPGGRDWSSWNIYRVDWMPKQTTWYVNGVVVATISYQVPKDPAGLIVNMWSDGGSWTGNMSLYDEAFLQIQWIEVAYNTSGPYAGSGARRRDLDILFGERDESNAGGVLEKRKNKTPGCKVVCGLDENVTAAGTPALLYNNTGGAMGGWKGTSKFGSLGWVSIVLGVGLGVGLL